MGIRALRARSLGSQAARRLALGIALAGAATVHAEPPPAAEAPAGSPPLRLGLPATHAFGGGDMKEPMEPVRIAAPRPLWQRLSVVEMPADPIPGAPPRRGHHALRIATDAPKAFLRGLGFEPSDCAAQLRAPARMKQERGDTNVDVQAQVRIGCRF